MAAKRKGTKEAVLILRISEELKRRAQKAASAKGRSLSGYIRRLIEKNTGA